MGNRLTTFVMTVGVTSDAFTGSEGPAPELQRILRRVADQLDSYPLMQEGVIRDIDGISVGIWGFENPAVWRPNVSHNDDEKKEQDGD